VFISIGAILFAGGPTVIADIFNVNHWYDLKSIKVSDGPNVNKLDVVIDRVIKADFLGDFDVTIYPADLSAPVCHGQGHGIAYKQSAVEVVSRSAEWLMGEQAPPKCAEAMVPGKYIANVTVTVHPPEAFLWWMPLPTDEAWSNIFEITAEDADPTNPSKR
jgi:hypothetical protein